MKLLLSYNHADWHRAGYVQEKFYAALGHDISTIHLGATPYWTDWGNRLPFYFPKGFPVTVPSVERKLGKRFDAVIEIDGGGQHHLARGRSTVPMVLWSMDTHLPSKRRFQRWLQPEFDYLYSCHKDYVQYFDRKPSEWLPVAADPDFHRKLDVPKIYDIAFLGNMNPTAYPERNRLIRLLSSKFNVKVFSGVYGDEMIRVINQTKVFFNRSLSGDLNMRVFEVLSCGSFLLTDQAPKGGLENLFEDGRDLAIYRDDRELLEKVEYFLSHEAERERIAAQGHELGRSRHTYYERAKTIVEKIATLPRFLNHGGKP